MSPVRRLGAVLVTSTSRSEVWVVSWCRWPSQPDGTSPRIEGGIGGQLVEAHHRGGGQLPPGFLPWCEIRREGSADVSIDPTFSQPATIDAYSGGRAEHVRPLLAEPEILRPEPRTKLVVARPQHQRPLQAVADGEVRLSSDPGAVTHPG